jgi:para-aminobenzoate synthetase/4-amino-4-deoxychorismate lyase
VGEGPPVEELVRRAARWPGLVCLRGAWAGGTPLVTAYPTRSLSVDADPIAALGDQPLVTSGDADAVGGGWFGRLAFDGASQLAFYDHVLRQVDGRWRFEALWSSERAAALEQRLARWRALLAAPPPGASGWWTGEFAGRPADDHLAAVERAVELIRAGELYQVNVCTRLVGEFAGSSAELFAAVVPELDPQFGAYLAGAVDIVSLSPELFLERRGRDVLSAPIKGTLPRTPGDGNAAALRRSVKDAAENVMIVDLVRNDLGRVCETGSVRPAALLEVQPHPGVWHLVSSVRGRLRVDVDDAELLAATFPPGSVTGAPKVRAVGAIAHLEVARRGTYTGAIGFASPVWGAQFSVAIRTFEIAEGRVELGVGGGITADSVPMLEWHECLHKAAPLLRAARTTLTPALRTPEPEPATELVRGGVFETLLGLDGVPVRLADHLARLDRSCRELYGAGLAPDVAGRVLDAAKAVPVGRSVLRVVASPDLALDVRAAPAADPARPLQTVTRVRESGLWRHKWVDRRWAAAPALFVADDGTVLETERGNVFLIEPDGTLVTPPLRDDLLPGVTRRALLDLARDEGRPTDLRPFEVAELVTRPAFWTSSLSGAVPIHRVDDADLPRADATVAWLAACLMTGRTTVR